MQNATITKTPVVWGRNQYGQEVKIHDKLLCRSGKESWFTHVLFNVVTNKWNNEEDYMSGMIVGSYLLPELFTSSCSLGKYREKRLANGYLKCTNSQDNSGYIRISYVTDDFLVITTDGRGYQGNSDITVYIK